jgi:hypothetical protein
LNIITEIYILIVAFIWIFLGLQINRNVARWAIRSCKEINTLINKYIFLSLVYIMYHVIARECGLAVEK